jgi:hypothetical protein
MCTRVWLSKGSAHTHTAMHLSGCYTTQSCSPHAFQCVHRTNPHAAHKPYQTTAHCTRSMAHTTSRSPIFTFTPTLTFVPHPHTCTRALAHTCICTVAPTLSPGTGTFYALTHAGDDSLTVVSTGTGAGSATVLTQLECDAACRDAGAASGGIGSGWL